MRPKEEMTREEITVLATYVKRLAKLETEGGKAYYLKKIIDAAKKEERKKLEQED